MNRTTKKHSDYLLSLAVFALISFGLIMIYSVSKYYSLEVTDGLTDKHYLKKQLIAVVIGLFSWVIFQAIDYRFWKKYIDKMFFVTIGLLLLPIILAPFNLSSGGRWIDLGFINFQPSELAKLTFLIYLAGWISDREKKVKNVGQLFWPFLVVVGIVSAVMLLQKDLGTLAVFVVLAASLYVVAGAPLEKIALGGAIGAFLVWLAIKIEPYRMQRFLTFLNPENDSLSAGYHIKNALIAIGSGGIFGLGFGQSKQKYLYLPEAHTDSIYAIISEELGLIRSAVIILIFVFIAIRGLQIAKRSQDGFARYLAVGITMWIFIQMAINIAAMLSLVPLTGIPLPFISYGGTSIIILLSAIGILTSVSKNQTYEKR